MDEDEFVNVMEVSMDEALTLISEKKIYDAKTVFAIQYLPKRRFMIEKLLCRLSYSYWKNGFRKSGENHQLKTLTFSNIIEHARDLKGLIGIIDCHSPEVLIEIKNLFSQGDSLSTREEVWHTKVAIIPGTELEILFIRIAAVPSICYVTFLIWL